MASHVKVEQLGLSDGALREPLELAFYEPWVSIC